MNIYPHSEETKNRISQSLLLPSSGDEKLDSLRLRNRLKMRKYRAKYSEKNKIYNREYSIKHPQHRRNANLRHRFGIVQADYERIFKEQDGCCGICEISGINLVVDHCHISKKVRGLLCTRCNTKLGFYEEIKRDNFWEGKAKTWLR